VSKLIKKLRVKVKGEMILNFETEIELDWLKEEDVEEQIENELFGMGVNDIEVTQIPYVEDFNYKIIERIDDDLEFDGEANNAKEKTQETGTAN